jgi:hypothetical protein
MRLYIVWTRTRVQTVDVRSGSVGIDAAFARFVRTRARLGLRASRYTLSLRSGIDDPGRASLTSFDVPAVDSPLGSMPTVITMARSIGRVKRSDARSYRDRKHCAEQLHSSGLAPQRMQVQIVIAIPCRVATDR